MTTRHFVLDAGRHAIQVLAFCCVVAVLTQTIWPQEAYSTHLVKSLSIGLVIWLVIEFGRLLVPQRHCYQGSDGGHGWPRGWRGGLLAAVGTSGGLLVGAPLGDWLTGTGQLASLRDRQVGLLITIAAGAVATYYFYARGRAAALEAGKAAAERDASQARLMLLQSQLEPHMLFNTLANLRALIGVDPQAAQQMLDRLDAYLRATLAASRSAQHPLAAEFARLDDYLALMAVRMGPRLAVALDLPDALAALPVPPLLLQPLVENAIRHGLEPRIEGGRIEVSARRTGDALVLTVSDSGVGFDMTEPAAGAGGFGLAQVRERIATAYGGRARVDVQSRPGGGTTVRIRLPMSGATS
ncbi:MAG TPA: histidine kinase [Ottowia sp.]|nr:histidine kinase [Ottowia sp.]